MISIHISDWNFQDRVIRVSRKVAQKILSETDRPASDRMNELYGLANKTNTLERDPRASEMEEADLFLSWPGTGAGFISNEKWDAEHAGDLAILNES